MEPSSSKIGPISIIGRDEYLLLVDKCHWLQIHLGDLDHQLNNCTFRLQSVQDQRLTKCWFALNLVELRRLMNLVVRLMFELQAATMGKSVNSDYTKYAMDQLCYFEFLWRCYFTERILQLNLQFRDYLKKYSKQSKFNKDGKSFQNKEFSDSKEEDSLIEIIKDVQPTFENVNKKDEMKSNKSRTPELDLSREDSSIQSRFDNQPPDVPLKDLSSEIISKGSIESIEENERKVRLDSKTAEFIKAESKDAADLIALGQLEASMRVNQQLMECIRNHIAMARLTVMNIYDTGQRSMHSVERTARNVKITQRISKLACVSKSFLTVIIILSIIMFIVFLISHTFDLKEFFRKMFVHIESLFGAKK